MLHIESRKSQPEPQLSIVAPAETGAPAPCRASFYRLFPADIIYILVRSRFGPVRELVLDDVKTEEPIIGEGQHVVSKNAVERSGELEHIIVDNHDVFALSKRKQFLVGLEA